MNKYQRQISKEVKSYMNYYEIDKKEYPRVKWILKNFTGYKNSSPCSDCDNGYCGFEKSKIVWCKGWV